MFFLFFYFGPFLPESDEEPSAESESDISDGLDSDGSSDVETGQVDRKNVGVSIYFIIKKIIDQ